MPKYVVRVRYVQVNLYINLYTILDMVIILQISNEAMYYSGVSRILCRGVLDSLRAKNFMTTPTLISHAHQLMNVCMLTMQCYYNSLVGVVYSLVKKVNDIPRRIHSFSLFLDMLVS